MKRSFVTLLVMALLAAACSGDDAETTTTAATTTTAQTTTSTTPPVASTTVPATTTTTTTTAPADGGGATGGLPRGVGAFASFPGVPMVVDEPAYAGPSTPVSLDGIYIPRSMQGDLDGPVVAALESQGFVIVPGTGRLFHTSYQAFHYEGEVYFVTTDVGYHYLHLAFSKVLRDLEQHQLLPILDELLTGLVDAARAQRAELAGTDLEDAADRVVQLYEAAATLAGLDVGATGSLAQQEVALAVEAADFVTSPITGVCPGDPLTSTACLVDFSLFKPRGHYTRNDDLERYFRAMSLLGNENFSVGYGETMQLAALAARVLVEDPELVDAWALIYEPTAFLVGMADDYSPLELAAILDEQVDGWRDDPSLVDVAAAAAAGRALLDLRPVGIDPEGASVRVMGVRFVIDSYIYDQLRYPSVGPGPYDRRYATPLDLVAAFGSELAYEIMDEEGTITDAATGEHWIHYDEQLATLREAIAGRNLDDWAATVYDAWLYALEPVWQPLGDAYPDFMQSPAWEVKDLQTGLGSYAELKHDTILYAKQSYAAEGGYEPVDYPPPRHWVEPNPVAFERMRAVLDLLARGLDDRGLLPADGDNAELIAELDAFLGRLAGLAADELAGRPISDADNDWLEYIGSAMEALWIRSSDEPDAATGEWPDEDLNSALIADIMRTTFAFLEIGTGYVDTIYVLVPNDEGDFQLAKGAVYSYYEFWREADEGRLTDQEWWELLADNPPARPAWQDPLFPPGSLYETGMGRGLDCWWFQSLGYESAVAYWVAYGMPSRMDYDGNGIPCDEGSSAYDPAYFSGLPETTGLFCRDLEPEGYSFAEAVAYWLREGRPDRMDADRNGIPCETVYPRSEIEHFFLVNDQL